LSLRRAVIEAVVIVGSILLAFSIDAAWDRSLEREERMELIRAIRDDMSGTRAEISEVMPRIEESLGQTVAYFEVLIEGTDVPVDSLSVLFGSTFHGFALQPPLSSYDGAITSGRIASIMSPELRAAFTDFDVARSYWEGHFSTLYDTHYLGPTWELRRTIGTQDAVRRRGRTPAQFQLDDNQLRAVLTSPEAYAAAEVHGIIYRNIYSSLRRMDEAASRAIAILDEELAG
jgi:hypothetical protein